MSLQLQLYQTNEVLLQLYLFGYVNYNSKVLQQLKAFIYCPKRKNINKATGILRQIYEM